MCVYSSCMWMQSQVELMSAHTPLVFEFNVRMCVKMCVFSWEGPVVVMLSGRCGSGVSGVPQ